jgi:hypothetical protein
MSNNKRGKEKRKLRKRPNGYQFVERRTPGPKRRVKSCNSYKWSVVKVYMAWCMCLELVSKE